MNKKGKSKSSALIWIILIIVVGYILAQYGPEILAMFK